MRSYKQRCGLAKTLDVVGDRWSLLIIRELLIRSSCRYTDLRNGLPGIATNLLADRLRELEEAGIVVREDAPPPIATTLFRLTERGRELEPAILLLGRWGAPLLAKKVGGDSLRAHWFVLPLKLHLVDRTADGPPISIELRAGDQPITVSASEGAIDVRLGAAETPDVVITGHPETILKLFAGKIDLVAGKAAGIRYQGDTDVLRRVLPVSRAVIYHGKARQEIGKRSEAHA